jgi:peroxiredoxin
MFAKAQLTAPDFSLTDIDGNTHHLYDQTAEGKTVVIEFFSVFCGTCAINTPVVENIWTTYGYSGDSVWVWGIEAQGVVDSLVGVFRTNYGVTFPLFGTSNDDVVIYLYDILYVPQYIVVCPDNSMKPYDISNLEIGVQACLATSVFSSNYNMSELRVTSTDRNIVFENAGHMPLFGNLQITSLTGSTTTYSLNLSSGEKEEIHLKTGGMYLYRLFDTEISEVKTGKIWVE